MMYAQHPFTVIAAFLIKNGSTSAAADPTCPREQASLHNSSRASRSNDDANNNISSSSTGKLSRHREHKAEEEHMGACEEKDTSQRR